MTTTSGRVGEIFRDITGTEKSDRKTSKDLPDSRDEDVQAAAIPQPVSKSRKREQAKPAKKSTAKKTAKKAAKKTAAKKSSAKKKG